MKYAFIANSSSLTPETYSVSYDHEGNHYFLAAVHGMKMTRALAGKLAEEGYQYLDLCGDYSEEKAKDISEAANGKLEVNYAKYSEEDLESLNALPSADRYGVIILGFDPAEDMVRLELKSDEYNTYIAIAGSEKEAAQAASYMVQEGIDFIELCGYFDRDKAQAVADAIGHKVPIGYCG